VFYVTSRGFVEINEVVRDRTPEHVLVVDAFEDSKRHKIKIVQHLVYGRIDFVIFRKAERRLVGERQREP